VILPKQSPQRNVFHRPAAQTACQSQQKGAPINVFHRVPGPVHNTKFQIGKNEWCLHLTGSPWTAGAPRPPRAALAAAVVAHKHSSDPCTMTDLPTSSSINTPRSASWHFDPYQHFHALPRDQSTMGSTLSHSIVQSPTRPLP
jgi:hypothetical protein